MKRIVLIAAFALIAAACGGGSGSGSVSETAWTLVGLGDTALVPAAPASIVFGPTDGSGAGETFGSTGCNNFNGPYQTGDEEGSITIGPFAMTLAACTDPALQAQEDAFLAALDSAATFVESEGTLELRDSGGAVTATFEALTINANLANTRWEAVGINNGTGGVQSVLPDTSVTLFFQNEGFLDGNGGCNTYTTAYRLGDEYDLIEGGSIELASISSTRKACSDEIDLQEQNYYAALEQARVWIIRGMDLELRSSDGALQVDFKRVP
jgi:heat shock protein HslJ